MPESPLADAVDPFLADPGTTFTVPGHKRSPELADALLQLDLPLVSGADDSRMTGDVLGRAERLAAQLWGADMCRFSVSGSTHGNQAFALAVARPGDKVIVARTLHKSLHAGLVLAGLEPVWVRPEVDADHRAVAGRSRRGASSRRLPRRPTPARCSWSSPATSACSRDIEAIAGLTHAAGVPLVVDQAWGAHLGFHPALPKHAIARGADGMVTSTHKNLTAFTQGSIVLARGERIDLARLDECFELLHTTSPSAAIMASSDRARALIEERGPELLGRTIEIVADARRRLSQVEGLTVVDADDPTKLVLALAGTGADGFEVERDLFGRGIRLEMADRDTLVPIVTLADTAETVGRLADGVADSVAARRGEPRPPASSTVWSLVAEVVMSPRDAYFAPRAPCGLARGGRPDRRRDRGALPAGHPGARARRADQLRDPRRPARRGRGRQPDGVLQRSDAGDAAGRRRVAGTAAAAVAVTPGMRMMLLARLDHAGRRRVRRDEVGATRVRPGARGAAARRRGCRLHRERHEAADPRRAAAAGRHPRRAAAGERRSGDALDRRRRRLESRASEIVLTGAPDAVRMGCMTDADWNADPPAHRGWVTLQVQRPDRALGRRPHRGGAVLGSAI